MCVCVCVCVCVTYVPELFTQYIVLVTVGLTITSGPQDMAVCIKSVAKINCGFNGASPSNAIPNWRIVYRTDSGSVFNNDTIDGGDISLQRINGLQWVADFDSGILNAPNSKHDTQSVFIPMYVYN